MARSRPSQQSKEAKRVVRQFVRPRYGGTLVARAVWRNHILFANCYAFIYEMNVAAKGKPA
jgi:hypothetical protein